MEKLLIFHPAVMPYRIDLFNNLSQCFNSKIFFYWRYNLNQKMDEKLLLSKLKFEPLYLDGNPRILNRKVRIGVVNILRKENADVVIMGEYSINTFLAYITKILFRLKCKIYTICDDSKDIAESVKGCRKVGRNFLENRLDGIILTNYEVLDYYKNNLKQEKLIVFPIIQDENSFREELLTGLSLSNKFVEKYKLKNKKVYMYAGRLTSIKNIPFLIKCFNELLTSNRDIVLILVGEGDQRVALEEYVNFLKISNYIIFVGRCDGVELKAWYNIGQIFILPSSLEPFGAVTNEALLSGQYVLCSKAAGSSCLINKSNGSLFSHINYSELVNLMLVYSEKISPIGLIILRDSKMDMTFKEIFQKLLFFLKN